MPRKTSRRRTSRHAGPRTSRRRNDLRRNEQRYLPASSPLDYSPLGIPPGIVRRTTLVDTDAPPPPRDIPMFQARERLVLRGKTGRTLKKPRKVVEPGAEPGAVAFLDYQQYGTAEDPHFYIQYMLVRDDMRGRGYGKTLLNHFMREAEAQGASVVHFGKIMSPQMWTLYERWRKTHDEGKYAPEVVGKGHF